MHDIAIVILLFCTKHDFDYGIQLKESDSHPSIAGSIAIRATYMFGF